MAIQTRRRNERRRLVEGEKVYQAVRFVAATAGFNLLWLIVSLGLITAGPAWMALQRQVSELAAGGNPSWKSFWRELRKSFRTFGWVGLVSGGGTLLLAFDLFLAMQLAGFSKVWVTVLVGCCCAFWVALQGWFWSINAFYEEPRREALHDAWLLLGREWSISLRIFLGSVGVGALTVFFPPVAFFFSGGLLAVLYEIWIHRRLKVYENSRGVGEDG